MRSVLRLGVLLLSFGMLGAAPAVPTITVLCGGAASAALGQIVKNYERDRGVSVVMVVGTAGQLRQKLASGTAGDVLIITSTVMESFMRDGTVFPGSHRTLGTTSIGIGVPNGAPKPDISTDAATIAMLRSTKRLAVPDPAFGASSGVAFSALLTRLGLAAELAPKEVLIPGGEVCEAVAEGKADACVQNVTEIVPVAGITLVGSLPEDMQTHLTYVGGVLARAANTVAAADFLRYLTTEPQSSVLRQTGFILPTN